MTYPADSENAKVHYLSLELMRRGWHVAWARVGKDTGQWERDGIEFAEMGRPGRSFLTPWRQLASLLAFCRRHGADCVYSDDWLFFRYLPLERLFFHVGVKVLGLGCVFDQRDPFIDFELAEGMLREGSWRHRRLCLLYRMISRFTDLSVFPSKLYEEEMAGRGLSSPKSLGMIRGVDPQLFRDRGEGEALRHQLGLDGKFVIGWFGMMLPYRRIDEVLIPLIEKAGSAIPEAHFLIGGSGAMQDRFLGLQGREPGARMTFLGKVLYKDLPRHIAACDVLLCPLNSDHRFTQNASPLKILESVAMGRPIIATATRIKDRDYQGLRGVVWTGMGFDDFMGSLEEVHGDYARYRREAEEQALDFERYTTSFSMAKIATSIEASCQ